MHALVCEQCMVAIALILPGECRAVDADGARKDICKVVRKKRN
jgi:hypothetical protein